MAERSRYPWRYALFLMAYYITNSVFQGFITVYYKGEGFSAAQIGYLCTAVPLVSVLAQPCWGIAGDRAKSRNRIIRILALCSAVVILLFRVSSSLWWLLPMVCLFAAFYTSIQPMGDSIILEALQPERIPFGPMRLAGGLSFAVASMLVGKFVETRMNWTLYLTAILLMLVFCATFALPETSGHEHKSEKASFAQILRMPHMTALLIMVTLLQITMGYFYSFFSVHFVSLEGGNTSLLGWCYFISAVSEAPFLIFSDKLFEKIGIGRLMCISAVVLSIRWLVLGTTSSVPIAMISQLCHSWGFIVITVGMSKYIAITFPDAYKARGQMVLSICTFGIARLVGSLGGGLLADACGYQRGFLICAVITVATLAVFAPMWFRAKPLNGYENAR